MSPYKSNRRRESTKSYDIVQGDEERRLNVQVSPFMDRSNPQVAELQRTFINNLITPIVFSMHKSGILAGEIAEDHGKSPRN